MAIATPSDSDGMGGYEYQFVTTPADWLLCTICHYPSRKPHLSDCCGNTFCKSCLEGLKKATAVANACPICRNEEFLTFHNKQADRLVRSLHVFCTNKDKGCEWQGELNDIIGHLVNSEGCKFEEVTCSNDCGKCLQRRYLTSHVEDECVRRKVDCQYCHNSGEHQFIEGKHKKQCPKFPVACPNKCKVGNVPRGEVEEHKKKCPLEQIQCEYHVVGCEEKMVRKDHKKHNKDMMEQHLFLSVNKVIELGENLAKVKKESTTKTDLALAKLETEFQNQIITAQKRIDELEIRLQHNTQLLCNDWYTIINTAASKLTSGDQVVPVILKMADFTKKKNDSVSWFSDPMYTHHMGYKLHLQIKASGWYNSGDMTVTLSVMKGPYDDHLRWPLKGCCEIKLLNQISDSEHHLGKGQYQNIGHRRVTSGIMSEGPLWFSVQFISSKDLQKVTPTCQYLRNDSIFLRVDYKLR